MLDRPPEPTSSQSIERGVPTVRTIANNGDGILKATLMHLTRIWPAILPKWNFTRFSRRAAAVCSNRLLKGVLVKDSVNKNAPY
jgi:hypothetical protein